jgi:hypothetical protein
MFFMKMGVLGLNKEYFSSNPSNAQIEAALLHRTFRGSIGTRTYNGNRSNEVKNYYPVQAVASEAFSTAPAASPAPVAAAPAPAPAPAPASPVSASEDTPF